MEENDKNQPIVDFQQFLQNTMFSEIRVSQPKKTAVSGSERAETERAIKELESLQAEIVVKLARLRAKLLELS